MDKDTRSAIERATQRARRLLEDDFVSQLEGTFDMLRSGEVAATGGPHLTPRQRVVREKIVAAVEHKRAAGTKPGEAVVGYARDAAFTALNRFVALKMLEARGLLLECVTNGEQSGGYKEFCGLAPGVSLLPDGAGYRLYIECLFDELSTEIKVLFDRRDPAAALWPKRQIFEDLLTVLNSPDMERVWGEDETIGWVYQFFNSGDERRGMREESQAPRDSRELAVRNQFFTPRYVVRFLAENTLATLWIEMMGEGGTRIADRCDYLVRDPESRGPRAKKDPRDLKILDPACGSGHFLLYAFDLLLVIYEEAWSDPGAARNTLGRTLRQDYPNLLAIRTAAPALILEHNLHGVDIDPRCTQIAALALWLRAQRAWKDVGVAASDRPRILQTHVVVAEPMPGDAHLVSSFAAALRPPLLAGLFRRMVVAMQLAGDLGTLLRTDAFLADEIRKAASEFKALKHSSAFLPSLEPEASQASLDFTEIGDDTFFERAEALLLQALRSFADSAVGEARTRRRLFAGDAAQGIALVDILRKRYDVVMMNPPFGLPTSASREYLQRFYSDGWVDIYAAFICRAVELCDPGGFVGAITSRTFVSSKKLAELRRRWLLPRLEWFVDLGKGVMDGANVEASAFILRGEPRPTDSCFFLDVHSSPGRDSAVLEAAKRGASSFRRKVRETLIAMPDARILFSLPAQIEQLMLQPRKRLEPEIATVRCGLTTFDDQRFLRAFWEVSPDAIGISKKWQWFEKGGEYLNYYSPIHLVINRQHDGAELAAVNERVNGQTAQSRQASKYYYRPGAFYTDRSERGFSARALPAGCVIAGNAPAILSESQVSADYLLGWLNARAIRTLIEMKAVAAKFYPGFLKELPWAEPDRDCVREIEAATRELIHIHARFAQRRETDPLFRGLPKEATDAGANDDALGSGWEVARRRAIECQIAISRRVDELYDWNSVELALEVLERDVTEEFTSDAWTETEYRARLRAYAFAIAFGRFVAIAHGLENVFWEEGPHGKWTARAKPTNPTEELIRERSSMAVKTALQSLVDAPSSQGTTKPKRAKGAR